MVSRNGSRNRLPLADSVSKGKDHPASALAMNGCVNCGVVVGLQNRAHEEWVLFADNPQHMIAADMH